MNNYSLSTNAPISEFIDMLREWLIAGNADPRAIDKVDELLDLEHYANRETAQSIKGLENEKDDMQRERDDIAKEFRALYDAACRGPTNITKDEFVAARACIERNKIT